jgi:predicted aldo/keto reductase-like oxidoreductase
MSEKLNSPSRRNFIKAAGATGLGLALAAGPAGAAKAKVPSRGFGKTGDKVSILSLGMMFDTENNQVVLRRALSLGVTHWDTANTYYGGRSEVGLGRFFRRFPKARKDIFLVTKSGHRDVEGFERHLKLSLERMRTGYVDLFFVHAVSSPNEMEPAMARWAEKKKAQGKIRYFGFSTHYNMADCLITAPKLGYVDAIMTTYNYRVMHQDDMQRGLDACHKKGIALTAMKTQGSRSWSEPADKAGNSLKGFMNQGYSPGQANLKVVWEDERISNICSQMPNLSLLKENAAAAMDKAKLSQMDKDRIAEFAAATSSGYCAGCTALCEGAMGHQAPVGEVMRFLMYRESYQEAAIARSQYRALPEEQRRGMLKLDYSPAEAVCPNHLPIASLMKRAAKVFA